MGEYRRDTSFHLLDFDTPEVAIGLKDFTAPYESTFKVFTGLFSMFNLKPVIPAEGKEGTTKESSTPKEMIEEIITLAMIESMFLIRLFNKYLSNFNKFAKSVADKTQPEQKVTFPDSQEDNSTEKSVEESPKPAGTPVTSNRSSVIHGDEDAIILSSRGN